MKHYTNKETAPLFWHEVFAYFGLPVGFAINLVSLFSLVTSLNPDADLFVYFVFDITFLTAITALQGITFWGFRKWKSYAYRTVHALNITVIIYNLLVMSMFGFWDPSCIAEIIVSLLVSSYYWKRKALFFTSDTEVDPPSMPYEPVNLRDGIESLKVSENQRVTNTLTETQTQNSLELEAYYKKRIESIYADHQQVLSSYTQNNRYLQKRVEILEDKIRFYESEINKNAQKESLFPEEKEPFFVKSDLLSAANGRQAELDRYKKHDKTGWEIGREYERYIGYCYEQKNFDVTYTGALLGKLDAGRDLITSSNGQTQIIQCKCWGHEKTVHEKHIFQLYGSTVMFQLQNPKAVTRAVFFTTASLSDAAKECADALNVEYYEHFPLQKHPLVKCNVSEARGKIYFLPFDKDYDKISMIPDKGDLYVDTVKEAEQQGFRYAHK